MHVDSYNQVRARNAMLRKESLVLMSKAQGLCDDLCTLGGDVRSALVKLRVLRNEVEAAISDSQSALLQGTYRGTDGNKRAESQISSSEISSRLGRSSSDRSEFQRQELIITGNELCSNGRCPGFISTAFDLKITDQLVEFRRIGFWSQIDSHDP